MDPEPREPPAQLRYALSANAERLSFDHGAGARLNSRRRLFPGHLERRQGHDLTPADADAVIGERNVGAEGFVLLTQQNSVQIDLLLDRSYSITAVNTQSAVRNAADGFLGALPDEARVRAAASRNSR